MYKITHNYHDSSCSCPKPNTYISEDRLNRHLLCGQGKDLETLLQRLKSDLHNCVGFIQEPKKLKDSVQTIYTRYVPQADGVSGARSLVD